MSLLKSLLKRLIKIHRERGFYGAVKAVMTYLFRLVLNKHYSLEGLCTLLRGKYTLSVNNTKIPIYVSQLADAIGLHHTYKTERSVWENIVKELKTNDTFWDVGANIGFYSLLAASYPEVNVIAFEPNPFTFKILQKNIEHNNRDNIRILNVALSESEGMAKFDTMAPHDTTGESHLTDEASNFTIEVTTRRGDKLIECENIPKPDVMKIDVEGAEYLVIKGMGNALSHCRLLFCEVHSGIWQYGNSQEDFEKYLKNIGFSIEKTTQVRGYSTSHIIARRIHS